MKKSVFVLCILVLVAALTCIAEDKPMDWHKMAAFLPDSFGGHAGEDQPSGEMVNLPNGAFSAVSQSYGLEESFAAISFMHLPSTSSPQWMLIHSQMAMPSFDSEIEALGTRDIKGFKMVFTLNKEDKECEAITALPNKIIVSLELYNVSSIDEAAALVETIDLAGLASL